MAKRKGENEIKNAVNLWLIQDEFRIKFSIIETRLSNQLIHTHSQSQSNKENNLGLQFESNSLHELLLNVWIYPSVSICLCALSHHS